MDAIVGCQRHHLHDRREQPDQQHADAHAEQRAEQRGAHCDHRAERDQQHRDGDGEPHQLCGARLFGFGALHHLAAEADLHPGRPCRLAGGDQRLDLFGGDLPSTTVVEDLRGGHAAVGRLQQRRGWPKRVDHLGDAVESSDPIQRRGDRFCIHGVRHLPAGGTEHRDGTPSGLRREPVLEQVERLLGRHAGNRDVVRGVRAQRSPQADDQRDGHDPRRQHPPRVPGGEPTESVQQ
ncbi:MAG: hypothetical protein M5T61_09740 [Acidimicrobiia bacterium]|nr:hypothetical protein [Acidimicrobiia bacterium]